MEIPENRGLTDCLATQDLCNPDANRLRRNLSAVINFAKFREEKLQPYIEMQEKTNELYEGGVQLKEQKERLVSSVHTNLYLYAYSM